MFNMLRRLAALIAALTLSLLLSGCVPNLQELLPLQAPGVSARPAASSTEASVPPVLSTQEPASATPSDTTPALDYAPTVDATPEPTAAVPEPTPPLGESGWGELHF